MITEEQARARILEKMRPLSPRTVSLLEARDRFAARDVFARVALPRFDNSAMDGYAVVASSCGDGKPQRLVGEQPAGIDRGLRIKAGETVRVFTGARDLTSPVVQKLTDEQLFDFIANGGPSKKPAHTFKAKGVTDDDVKAVITYIRSIKK